MSSKFLTAKYLGGLYLMSPLLLILPGCATRSWVSEQLNPVETRMTSIEQQISGTDARLVNLVSVQLKPLGTRVDNIEQRVSGVENRLASAESNILEIGSETEKALREFKNLRLERRLVRYEAGGLIQA